MTRQEMFNRAVRGLAGQQWRKAIVPLQPDEDPDTEPQCLYLAEDGCRCAWGHVDPEATSKDGVSGTVRGLAYARIGIAGTLSRQDLDFASDLQRAHDTARSPEQVKQNMHETAKLHELTWPEDIEP